MVHKESNNFLTWQKIKDILKSEGFKGVKSGHYQADSLFACGCGAKLDPRNFGSNGYIDRDVYFVDVRQEDSERAKNLLSENGIESVIDDLGNLGKV